MNLSIEILNKIKQEQKSDSFYILDSVRFKNNFDALLNAFKDYYSNTNIAYSYKTNYIPRFCNIVDNKGGFAEVVSGMEMNLAKEIGVNFKNIYFNGPAKGIEYVEELLLNGGYVNIDSLEELENIIKLSNKHKKFFSIGLRCSFDIGDSVISRFGFDINGNEFTKAIQKIEKSEFLLLKGLHCHFATRSLSSWENRTKGMLQLIDKKFINHKFDYISLGGGLYGNMQESMKKQFSVKIPTFKDYAKVSAKVFSQYFTNKDYQPLLIIEPGTALVANAMQYVTQVKSIKVNQGRTIATLSGSSYNINPKADRTNFSLPINIFSSNNINKKVYNNVFFAGYTCIENDYLYSGYNGTLAIEDYVLFDEVGSYSVVMKPPFINPNVPVIEILESNKSYNIIKKQENFNDIFHTYNFKGI